MPNQLIIENAPPPGEPSSYYSEETSLVAAASGLTLIPQVGWILWEAGQDSDLTVRLQLTLSPQTLAILIPASAGGMVWSDGSNLFVNNAGTQVTAKYFVLAHKP